MSQVQVTSSLERPSGSPLAPRTLAGGSAVVAVGMAVAQLLGYAYNLVVSRSLGPVGYGEVAALLGVVVVGSVPATALQVVVARRTATAVGDHPPGEALRAFWPVTLGLAVVTGGGLCLLAVPLTAVLHLTSVVHVLLTAAILAPFAVTSAVQGALQGTSRYLGLSVVFAVTGVARFAGGALGLLATHSVTGVLAGTAVGGALSATACAVAVLGTRSPAADGLLEHLPTELGHVMVAVGGLLALTNLDLLLARAVLPAHEAGLYAAGSLATKAVYWAPQFVAVSVFPRLTDPAERRRLLPRAMAVVAAIGGVATLLAAVAGGPLLRVLVGPAYDAVAGQLWIFCLLGALLAVVQLLVSSGIAARDRRVALLVWAACVLEVVLVVVVLNGSITQVVTAATMSVAALAVAAFAARR
jgi:O-antigen/teichoic acid export membrane protein